MKIELLNGVYQGPEALDLVTRLIQTRIQFQEERIASLDTEEDIKLHEKRIVDLQNSLSLFRSQVRNGQKDVELFSGIDWA